MDVFDEELLAFWKAANEVHLRYIMIGGVATNLHGYYRTTSDIDLWMEDTPLNRQNLIKTFKKCAIGDFQGLSTIQFVPGWTYFHLNNEIRLDVMTSVKGLEDTSFDKALNLASIADIFDVKVPFLQLNQLIESKKASNRPKDQIDIIELEKIKKLRE